MSLDVGDLRLLLGAITFLFGSGLLIRWLERPRLRVEVTEFPGRFNDQRMTFDAANVGGRPLALFPVVELRGFVPNMLPRRPGYYPGELVHLLPRRWRSPADRLLQRIVIPRSLWCRRRVFIRLGIDRAASLQLPPHSGRREFVAAPKEPSEEIRLGLVFFPRLVFSREGSRRRLVARFIGLRPEPVSRTRYWIAVVRFALWGSLPKREASVLE